MAAVDKTPVAPKQRVLTTTETITSFNAWKDNFLYVLGINKSFAPFLLSEVTWGKYSSTTPFRGFTDLQARPP